MRAVLLLVGVWSSTPGVIGHGTTSSLVGSGSGRRARSGGCTHVG